MKEGCSLNPVLLSKKKSHNMETNSQYHTPRRTNGQSIYSKELELDIPQLVQETSDKLRGGEKKIRTRKNTCMFFCPFQRISSISNTS